MQKNLVLNLKGCYCLCMDLLQKTPTKSVNPFDIDEVLPVHKRPEDNPELKRITSKISGKRRFNLDNHVALEEYGLMAKPSPVRFKTQTLQTSLGKREYVDIPKEYIGVDKKVQRKLNTAKVAEIKRDFESDFFRPPLLIEAEDVDENGNERWFYSIVDGQHGSAACPDLLSDVLDIYKDKPLVFCRIVRGDLPLAVLFTEANNKKKNKPAQDDDNFWALYNGYYDENIRGCQFNHIPLAKEVFEELKPFNFKAQRNSNQTDNWGTHASQIYKFFHKYIYRRVLSSIKKDNQCTDKVIGDELKRELKERSLTILRQATKVYVNLLGQDCFTKVNYGGDFWAGLFDFLTNEDYLGLQYEFDDLYDAIVNQRSYSNTPNEPNSPFTVVPYGLDSEMLNEAVGTNGKEYNQTPHDFMESFRGDFLGKKRTVIRGGKEKSLSNNHVVSQCALVWNHLWRTGFMRTRKNLNYPNETSRVGM